MLKQLSKWKGRFSSLKVALWGNLLITFSLSFSAHAGTCHWAFKDPSVKDLSGQSFSFVESFKIAKDTFYLLRKPESSEWGTFVGKFGFQGDLTEVFKHLGLETASKLGFKRYYKKDSFLPLEYQREEYLVIPGPHRLMEAVSFYARSRYLLDGGKVPLTFYPVEGHATSLSFLRSFVEGRSFPFSTKGQELVHDFNYHYFSFLIPKKLVDTIHLLASNWLKLRSDLVAKGFDSKQIENADKAVVSVVDGALGNMSQAIFSKQFTEANVKEHLLTSLKSGVNGILSGIIRSQEFPAEQRTFMLKKISTFNDIRIRETEAYDFVREADANVKLFIESLHQLVERRSFSLDLKKLEQKYSLEEFYIHRND